MLLLVEDNELNADMLSRRLKRKGFDVLRAHDGAEAISMAKQTLPELILMDLGLPGIDGYEAARQIKSHSWGKDILIMALTAHAMAEDKSRALAAGCDDYESKPVNFERLLEKIQRYLVKHRD